MKRCTEATLNLELGFADKDVALNLLNSLSEDRRVAVNITRARITESSAFLCLELRGPGPRICEVAALLNSRASLKDDFWRPTTRAS
ncbi:MAG TPA: hypothetical protein VE981_18810 [Planctomycetota bacterium]|nr:hypothetical protein [Planctomycetota bacterium]